jgi:hypothetical protein
MQCLLAVDLGIRSGMAMFNSEGKLLWFRSTNFGNAIRMRRGIRSLLDNHAPVDWLVIEGGGPLAKIWMREAAVQGTRIMQVNAEEWRNSVFYPRQHSDRHIAKRNAIQKAREVISGSGLPLPKTMQDDAAEAILAGVWAMHRLGWVG